MARNDDRRSALGDAAVTVLARQGARGLTHRAVDRAAGVAPGTTSNYFRTRQALLEGVVRRIAARLAPDPRVVARLAEAVPDRASYAAHLRDVVRRLLADPDVALAWWEVRLESARQPWVAELVADTVGTWFAQDLAHQRASGLPGGPAEVALLHYAVDGLVLDRLTVPIDPGTSVEAVVDRFVAGLLPD